MPAQLGAICNEKALLVSWTCSRHLVHLPSARVLFSAESGELEWPVLVYAT